MGKIGSNSVAEALNYDICKNQGEIYEIAAKQGYNMLLFSKQYLNSDFCNKSFDKIWSLYHFTDAKECLYEIDKNITISPNKKSSTIFNSDVAWWIGFTYKQLQIETGKTSKELSEIIPFEELCSCYSGLHTVDEDSATDEICKKHNLAKI